MSHPLNDPFSTAELRSRVLDAWAASPARFREDANAEEDYALGGYRDRVVVELAQNAADAAARAGVPGRLRLTLRDGTLTASNTGAPLDAAGVEALSTLRASSKRDDQAGTLSGGSGSGSRRWSRSATRRAFTRPPALSAGPGSGPGCWRPGCRRWRASLRRAAGMCRCCGFLSMMMTGRMGCRRRGSPPRSSCRCAIRPRSGWSPGCWPRPGRPCCWRCRRWPRS